MTEGRYDGVGATGAPLGACSARTPCSAGASKPSRPDPMSLRRSHARSFNLGRSCLWSGNGRRSRLAHPVAQGLVVDAEIVSDVLQRTIRLEREPDRSLAKL